MSVIGVLDILLRGNTSDLDQAFGKATKNAKKWRRNTQDAINNGPNPFQAFASKGGSALSGMATKLAGSLAAFFAIKHIVSEISNQLGEMAGLNKLSAKTGIATDKLTAYGFAFKKAGIEQEQMGGLLGKLSMRISEAASGGGEAVEVFKELGLSAKELNGLDTDTKFRAVVDALAKIPTQGDRVRIAMKLMEEGGAGIATAFADGSAVLDEMQAKAQKLGLAVSPIDAQQAENTKRAMEDLSLMMDGLWRKMAVEYAPMTENLFTSFTEGALSGEKSTDGMRNALDGLNIVMGGLLDTMQILNGVFHYLKGIITGALAGLFKVGEWMLRYNPLLLLLDKVLGMDLANTSKVMAEEQWNETKYQFKAGTTNFTEPWWHTGATEQTKKIKAKAGQQVSDRYTRDGMSFASSYDASKPLHELITKYKEEAAVLGLTNREAEIRKAGLRAGSKALEEQAKALDKVLTANEVWREYWDADPMVSATKALKRYTTALKEGTIDQAEHWELVRKASLDAMQSILGFDGSPLDSLAQKQDLLDKALERGWITADHYAQSLQNARESMLGIEKTPTTQLENYWIEIRKIGKAWEENEIDAEEYWRKVSKLQGDLGIGKSASQDKADYLSKKNQLDHLLAIGPQNGGIDQQQYNDALNKAMPEYGRSVYESTRTPLETYQTEMDKLMASGLSDELIRRKALQLKKDLGFGELNLASISEMGSKEARSDILKWQFQRESNDPNVQILNIEKQSLEEQKRQTEEIKRWGSDQANVSVLRLP